MYLFIAGNGFEDIEGLAIIDVLRRADIAIETYGVGDNKIKSRSNVVYLFEKTFKKVEDVDINKYEGILLPGGPGTNDLVNNEEIIKLIKNFYKENKLIYAICAAPILLDKAGILNNRKFTSYPGVDIKNGTYIDEKVVVDGNIITSKGVGTAIDGALKLVEIIRSKEIAKELAKKMVYYY
ncbi:MAG: DJ-1/PfpI family protein [Spirochaetes bacterium]|nr:DJ-1/PfpI family protein [Spirochaetota bacterium]